MWVESKKDHALEFIQVSEDDPRNNRIVDPDIESAETLRSLPLLRHLSDKDWGIIGVNDKLKEYTLSVTSEDWECDPNSILEFIEKSGCIENAILFDDLFSHSHKGEFTELASRIKLASGDAMVSNGEQLAEAMQESRNSEIFVTWEEVLELPENSSWADWLLFLHPEQKELSLKKFKGPARLRGVSGSGKTCVMLHRARFLAKKYKEPILLVTLTESMRKLLDLLIKELCGVESSYIHTLTINGLAESIIKDLHPKGEGAYLKADAESSKTLLSETIDYVKKHKDVNSAKLAKLTHIDLRRFIEEEVYYIRSRLRSSQFDHYLDSRSFKRHGRKIGLSSEGRRVFVDAANYKTNSLKKLFRLDYEGVVSAAISLLTIDKESLDSFGWAKVDLARLEETLRLFSPYRCILVDEVQDLSQLEIAMIGAMPISNKLNISSTENGLFLVGDGAQTIYNKGFVLKNCGINVSNRSYVLKKNYRNSKEIMTASYALIEKYEFADVDEDNIANPTKPDFPSKSGERPFLIKCRTSKEEIQFVCSMVKSIVEDYQSIEDTLEYPEVCIIGLNSFIRREVSTQLKSKNINWGELKQSAGIENNNCVSISTIESAKGHEFKHVFIVGVIEGAMPHKYIKDDDVSREASRLYVAMTRACESLYISYSFSNNQPSRFLIDIQSHCNEYNWRSEQLELIE